MLARLEGWAVILQPQKGRWSTTSCVLYSLGKEVIGYSSNSLPETNV